ncbi:MAG TPA: prepilin peptidase [Solirubrobacteraceae bacterium]|jgi:leader peptidase (prepilin peptidase)/N-methyltransferase
METAFVGVLGAVFGSFLNVVAERLPRRQSIVLPASHCNSCGTPIKPYDNIPLLSWLLLRGRCRSCKAPISLRYPLVEAATAGLCVAVVLAKSSAAATALGIALVLLLLPLALIDLEHRVLPNAITLPGCVLAIALGLALDPSGEPTRLIAGAAAGGVFLIAALAKPGGMGMGDVKLAAMLGLFLGKSVIPAILIALIAGVAIGGIVIARRGVNEGRKTAVPFGPFLALGGAIALFAGEPLLDWYSTSFVH